LHPIISSSNPPIDILPKQPYFCKKDDAMTMPAALNNAQLEILQLFASDLSEEELSDLRQALIEFRYQRLQKALDKLEITPERLREWESKHLRTPYQSQIDKTDKP